MCVTLFTKELSAGTKILFCYANIKACIHTFLTQVRDEMKPRLFILTSRPLHCIAKKAEDLVIVPGRSPIYMAEDLDIYIYMAEDLDIYMAEDLDTLYMAGRIGFWVGD